MARESFSLRDRQRLSILLLKSVLRSDTEDRELAALQEKKRRAAVETLRPNRKGK